MSAHILRNHKSCTQLGRGRVTTNAYSWYSRGEREWLLRVWEREGNWKSPFPKFGNGKGIKKSNPKFREWEGNEKIPFPKFGNGKGMKKIHSQNSGTGREWKNPFPKFGKGNQRPPFLGMTGNGNSRSPLGGNGGGEGGPSFINGPKSVHCLPLSLITHSLLSLKLE